MNTIKHKLIKFWAMTAALWIVTNCAQVYAVEVENLFVVEVPVSDQSVTVRQQAAQQGLREMLVRKSGTEAVLQTFEVKQALPKAMAFLQRFEYKKNESAQAIKNEDSAQSIEANPFLLSLHFDPILIDNLIQSAGTGVWGTNRPMTLIWLAVADEQGRQLLSDDGDVFPDVKTLKTNARRRGIPVLLPLLDFDDRLNIQFSDVWGRFPQPILAASERYGADAIVAGQVFQQGEFWQANLLFMEGGRERAFSLNAADRAQLYATMINHLTETLCQQYCVQEVEASIQTPTRLVIAGISGFSAYKKAESELAALSAIRKVQPSEVIRDNLVLSLQLLGDVDAVNRALTLNSHFEPMDEKSLKQVKALLANNPQAEVSQPLSSVQDEQTDGENTESLASHLSELQAPKESLSQAIGELNSETQNDAESQIDTDSDSIKTLYYRWIE